MEITVVTDESGEVVAAVVHALQAPSPDDPSASRVKPSPTQTAVTVALPAELAHRTPDGEFLDMLRRDYTVKDGSLVKKQ